MEYVYSLIKKYSDNEYPIIINNTKQKCIVVENNNVVLAFQRWVVPLENGKTLIMVFSIPYDAEQKVELLKDFEVSSWEELVQNVIQYATEIGLHIKNIQ